MYQPISTYKSKNGNHEVSVTKYADRYWVESRVFDGVKWQLASVNNSYKTLVGALKGAQMKMNRLSPHVFVKEL